MKKEIAEYLETNGYPNEKAMHIATRFSFNRNLEAEFCTYIDLNSFPLNGGISVNGYTAEAIYKKYCVEPYQAYFYLLSMSANFENTLAHIKKNEKKRIGPVVTEIEQEGECTLAHKYTNFYVRFRENGWLCDYLLAPEEARAIVCEQTCGIRKFYENTIKREKLSLGTYIYSEISQFLWRWCDADLSAAQTIAQTFLEHPNVAREFYNTLMLQSFPDAEIAVNGITPSQLFYEKDFPLWKAYFCMIEDIQ